MAGDRADIMYSDPPWGEGNIRYWATMNRKMTGAEVQPAPLQSFLDAIFGIAGRYVSGFLLIEYGERWAAMIQQRGMQAGFQAHGIVKLRYRSGRDLLPLDLHLFARPGLNYPHGYAEAVEGSYGYDTLRRAVPPLVSAVKKQMRPIILDPCCGMGYTAQAAIDNGLAFRGNELNAKRLEKTVARLSKCQ
jgi:hypothetical protein